MTKPTPQEFQSLEEAAEQEYQNYLADGRGEETYEWDEEIYVWDEDEDDKRDEEVKEDIYVWDKDDKDEDNELDEDE